MAEQQNWRWCNKCKSITYSTSTGPCAGGGTHDSSQSMWYAMPLTDVADGATLQAGWSWCWKCQALFRSAQGATGHCSAGGAHDATGSSAYSMATAPYPSNGGQDGWKRCVLCQQLVQPYQATGRCAAGGDHQLSDETAYFMKVGYPDPPLVSDPFGGSGGVSFNDSQVLSPNAGYGPIRQLFIRAGNVVDSIAIGYANGVQFTHGTSTGGTLTAIRLDADEYITEVQGRAGTQLDQITFVTSKRTLGPFGGGGGSPFSVVFRGCALQYLFGRSGQFIDQIGFGYGRQLQASTNVVLREYAVGGTGGNPFDDLSDNGGLLGKITGITVRAGTSVDKIEVQYQNGPKLPHGGDGGTATDFAINDDEWLTEIRGRAGTGLDAVQFVLSSGRMSPVYGGTGGSWFQLKKSGCVISAFFGRAGRVVDQLGVCFSDQKPKKLTISSITYDMNNFHLSETPKALASHAVINRTTTEQTTSTTLTDEVTESETISTTLTTGFNLEVALEVSTTAYIASSKTTVKFGYSFQAAKTTEHTTTKTRSISHQLTTVVAPGKTVKGTAQVTAGTYDVPWTAQGTMTYLDNSQSSVTVHGKLTGVQCYGQSVVYEEI